MAAYCRTASRKFPDIKVRQEDAVRVLEREPADYVFANHLLHHLSDDQVISFLQMLDEMPVRRYVLSDIARSCFAWLGFRLVARPLAPRSYIVADGLRSILRAFTVDEVRDLVAQAKLKQPVQVIPPFPESLRDRGRQRGSERLIPEGVESVRPANQPYDFFVGSSSRNRTANGAFFAQCAD